MPFVDPGNYNPFDVLTAAQMQVFSDNDNYFNSILTGSTGIDGWQTTALAPDTVAANGNGSYTLTFNGIDLTAVLSKGMKLRTTRTVAAPIQCAALNGTNQYFVKTSPAGMTFTDDFVVSAWVKLESYPPNTDSYTIASRYNGTSGWTLDINASGQVQLVGLNGGASNNSYIRANQSLTLNRWVHITAQLDMSAFTATTTTSYIMFDGVDVPCVVARNGTNPTALVQAGNLEIGGRNGGLQPFPGKVAQVAIYSAKVAQATILASMNQTLVGTETSLISAYKLSNSVTDLNANANNLTAQNSAATTATDSPFGNQGVSTTLDYGLIQTISFSTNTTVVAQVPSGCTIPTSGGVASVAYSVQGSPYGFPKDEFRWAVIAKIMASISTSLGSTNQWYASPVSIKLPIGNWKEFGYQGTFQQHTTVAGTRYAFFTLSPSAPTNAVRNQNLTAMLYNGAVNGAYDAIGTLNKSLPYINTALETHVIYGDIADSSGTETFLVRGDLGAVFLMAIPAGI